MRLRQSVVVLGVLTLTLVGCALVPAPTRSTAMATTSSAVEQRFGVTQTPLAQRSSVAPTATAHATAASSVSSARPPPTVSVAPTRDLTASVPFRSLTALVERVVHPTCATPTPVLGTATTIGSHVSFSVDDEVTRTREVINTTLVYLSPHALWYVEDGVPVTQEQLQTAAQEFEQKIYPLDVTTFGKPRFPDLSGLNRLTIVVAKLQGVAGYFTASDQYLRCIAPSSNQRNAIYINETVDKVGSPALEDTLVHELQHLIHWDHHPADSAWVNEGMSVYAEYLAGFSVDRLADAFLKAPGTQLTDWSDSPTAVLAHYGAAFLFIAYLAQHYGPPSLFYTLLSSPLNDWAMINEYLQSKGASADQVFAQWVVANVLNNSTVDGGAFAYKALHGTAGSAVITPLVSTVDGSVAPFGTSYYRIDTLDIRKRLVFAGAQTVRLLPTLPYTSDQWWSNHGDLIDTTLTRQVDLTHVQSATLSFDLWLDIEKDYDYLYVEVSTNGGKRWQLLPATHTTTANPTGANLGVGYTGESLTPGSPVLIWWHEHVDLTPYAGRNVLVRFEYVTDEEYSGPGAAIRNVRIPQIGLDESGRAGQNWVAHGWYYVPNNVKVKFLVQLIAEGARTTVTPLHLDASNRGDLNLASLPPGTQQVIVAVSALADKTTQPAAFRIALKPGPGS
ncbi:MAG: immune inhibitor A [Chloroflexi bacterium]|nr:immune inhibitor A [Chloroflexota bacterium]